MKLSQSGLETNKIENLSDTFAGQEVLLQTGQLVQYASGIFGFNTVPLRVMRNIEKVIRTVFDKFGFSECLLPTLQPEAIWQESKRWDVYINEGTMLPIRTEKGNFCMAPTAEEAVVMLAKRNIKSYKSLPVTYYQIGEKFRNELRNRGYLMRGKAFQMLDAYSFNRDKKCLEKTYEQMRAAYLEVFKTLGLDVLAVAADSGAIGGAVSEEFMFISPVGEDTIFTDKKTGQAYSIEVLDKPENKSIDRTKLEQTRAVELGHIFQLGKKYSESMNATYANEQGKPTLFEMGCYGIGVSRVLAVIYDNFTTLPLAVAPYLVQIVCTPEKQQFATDLYTHLQQNQIGAILDDREHMTIGAKIQDVKKLKTPYMIILGNKSDQLQIENVATGEKTELTKEKLVAFLKGAKCSS